MKRIDPLRRVSPGGLDAMLVAVMGTGREAGADFDAFYTREYGRIVALAYALIGDRGAAEDVAQDAFLAAHQQWDRVGGYDAPGAWVRRVVMNRSRSGFRKRTREARALTRFAGLEMKAVDPEYDESEAFWRAVRTLPPKLARCVVLHYVDDLDATAIGSVLDIAPSTARVHLHRARTLLAKLLDLEDEA